MKHEFSMRVTAEVQRIEREKADRADAKLRLENERLRKQLDTQRESVEYLERMLEKQQTS
jgi:hypothetical protein